MTGLPPLELNRFFAKHPALESERLLLRGSQPEDAAAIYEYASDPEVTRHVIWPRHRSIEDAHEYLAHYQKKFSEGEALTFSLVEKTSGTLIGGCGFHHFAPKDHRVELGYVLNRKFWGHGFMTEAVLRVLTFGFEEMGFHRVEAVCDADNVGSYRVMERIGMTFEGLAKDYEIRNDHYISLRMYSILRPDFRAMHLGRL